MANEYGSRYGTEYFFFPEASREEVERALSESPEADCGNIRENFCFIGAEERREIENDDSPDVWDQTLYRDGSLKDAIRSYWN